MKIFRVFVKSFSYVRYSKRKPRPQSKPKVAGQKYIALAAYQKLHMEKAATNTSVKMFFTPMLSTFGRKPFLWK